MGMRLSVAMGILLSLLLVGGCASSGSSFDSQLGSILKPYRFSIAGWEFKVIPGEIKDRIFGGHEKPGDEVQTVIDYFSHVEQIKTLKSGIEAVRDGSKQDDIASLAAEENRVEGQKQTIKDTVERIIAGQIKDTLAEQGIFNPVDSIGLKMSFPPVNFKLDKPPHVLVVSPRDRIETMREITLRQDMSLEQIEAIENEVDALHVSSLVVELGGFGGTYPSFAIDNGGLRFTIDTATEEWLHQYLTFKPLGFRYVLDLVGISKNYEINTMNETLASMVSKEIGSLLYDKYYAKRVGDKKAQPAETGFDYNREMREIRRAVDQYLAQGQIEQAEKFMEQKRQYLASHGYHIRKLNQAYFAFHGSYADSPTSISPIGVELKKLRSQSASLKDFLNTVASMTSRQDLINRVK